METPDLLDELFDAPTDIPVLIQIGERTYNIERVKVLTSKRKLTGAVNSIDADRFLVLIAEEPDKTEVKK